jgi:MFS transporter, DHA1 family, multidrug resistance protein
LPVERRVAITWPNIITSARTVVTDRMSVGYSVAMALMSSALFGFLLSVQQIFEHQFKRPDLLPTGFAIMAAGMAVASLINATIVQRYGMRLIGHTALFFFTAVAGVHALIAMSGMETLVTFITLQTAMMLGFSLVAGNFGAMAMENMGEVAGMANSLQGTLSNILGLVIGTVIGQAFNGTTVPLYTAYFICGLVALVAVYITEGGRFFTARNASSGE